MVKEINFSGIGNLNGGEFGSMNASGIVKVFKDIKGKNLIVSGIMKTKKSIDTDELNVEGILKVGENLKVLKGIISGVVKSDKNTLAKNLEVNGILKTQNLEVENINVLGNLFVKNNCQSEEFYLNGKIVINGLLSAEKVNIKAENFSKIKEVGGSDIRIEGLEDKKWDKFIFWKKKEIKVELIEGDTVFLENVTCNLIRGKKVKIGKGCKIKKIEYSDEAILNEKSKIKECIKG